MSGQLQLNAGVTLWTLTSPRRDQNDTEALFGVP